MDAFNLDCTQVLSEERSKWTKTPNNYNSITSCFSPAVQSVWESSLMDGSFLAFRTQSGLLWPLYKFPPIYLHHHCASLSIHVLLFISFRAINIESVITFFVMSIVKLSIVLSHFSRVWLCDPMACSPPGSSIHGIFQARILQWVACPPLGNLPRPEIKLSSLLSPASADRALIRYNTGEKNLFHLLLVNKGFPVVQW